MRLAVSNIAWPAEADETAAAALAEHGVEGVEIAPTKIWPRPLEADPESIRGCRRFWESRDLPIVSMQALLYGRGDLTIFDDQETRRKTRDYLAGIIRLADRLGARALVFGSPKNRKRGALSRADADQIAIPFFRRIGELAAHEGIDFCLEPNPPQYDCDYVVNAREGLDLVRRVAAEGFELHLDTAAMALAGDSPSESIMDAGDRLRHFHLSEPYLGPVGSGSVDHEAFAHALAESGYSRWISIEMKQAGSGGDWLSSLVHAVQVAQAFRDSAARASESLRRSA
jgi:sugar phosphate isomerase/epimerase